MEPKPIVIKKYENRRLYDTTNSRYVNLDEVAQLIREGRDLQVIDAATGDDLTRPVLTQIIMEQAKEPDSAFPLDVLRQMVVASGRATQESALKYMKAMFDLYQNAYRVMSPPLSPFEFMPPPGSRPASDTAPPSRTPNPPDQPEVNDELKRRIEGLESLVARMRPEKRRGRKTGKPPQRRRSR
jgi:polyhydroxyalkanoate synthesis repressor PhaR